MAADRPDRPSDGPGTRLRHGVGPARESNGARTGAPERRFVQYWDSFEALRDYARDSDRLHFPAWQEYYDDGTSEDTAVGIWHETYVIDPDGYETVYSNMPPHGVGATDDAEIVPASDRRTTAAGRLGRSDGTDAPLDRSVDDDGAATPEVA